jgi:hypothetical protein
MAFFRDLVFGLLLTIQAAVPVSALGLMPRDSLAVPVVSNWKHQGCWIDNGGNRTLQNGAYNPIAPMTVESCLSYCANGQYLYAGVEYGGECFCARSVLAGTTAMPETDCNMHCNGNSSEACGGPNRLNLFMSLAYSIPTIANGSSGYTYAGCFNDAVGSRT